MRNPFQQFGGRWNFVMGQHIDDWKILGKKIQLKELRDKKASLRGIAFKKMRREISKEIVQAKIELMELTLSRE